MRVISLVVAVLLCFAGRSFGEIKTKEVEYQLDGVAMKGYLAWDDATDAKRPGVLVIHEWWGLNDYAKSRCRQLAELGYIAFACDMYGNGTVATDAAQAGKLAGAVKGDVKLMRARAAAGLKVLADSPMTDKSKLGAIGYCFGGTTVLQLACSGADVRAVVSFHGSLFRPSEDDTKAIKCKVMICNGGADGSIKPDERAALVGSFEANKVDYQFIDYANAKHGFTNPKGAAYQEAADKRSWRHMRAFFDEAFDRAAPAEQRGRAPAVEKK